MRGRTGAPSQTTASSGPTAPMDAKVSTRSLAFIGYCHAQRTRPVWPATARARYHPLVPALHGLDDFDAPPPHRRRIVPTNPSRISSKCTTTDVGGTPALVRASARPAFPCPLHQRIGFLMAR